MIENGDTATVQTLAAEVRVLVVGKRQLTSGIVRQLDVVKPDEIEPFGRVEARAWGARRPDYDDYCMYVVGRSVATGALVRSHTVSFSHRAAYSAWWTLPLIVLASR